MVSIKKGQRLRKRLEKFFWEEKLGPVNQIASPNEKLYKYGQGQLNSLIDKLINIYEAQDI